MDHFSKLIGVLTSFLFEHSSISNVPRWSATKKNDKSHLLFPLIMAFISIVSLITSSFFVIDDPTAGKILVFVLVLSVTVYFVGRLYGEFTRHKDYIEITEEGLEFRSTPPFGMGWLAKSDNITFDRIYQADLVEIAPFYNASDKKLAIRLQTTPSGNKIIGNSLDRNQLLQVGLALQGTVTITNALAKFLGADKASDTLKDIVDGAKTLWNKFQQTREGGKQ